MFFFHESAILIVKGLINADSEQYNVMACQSNLESHWPVIYFCSNINVFVSVLALKREEISCDQTWI